MVRLHAHQPNKRAMTKRKQLSFDVWKEIERRYILGDSLITLQRDYDVGMAALRARLCVRAENVKIVAHQIAEAETAFDNLNTEDQITTRKLADELRFISHTMARAGRMAAMTAARLTTEAEMESRLLRVIGPEGREMLDRVRVSDVAALMKTANLAAEIPMGLIRGNKEAFSDTDAPDRKAQQLSDVELNTELARYGINLQS